MLVQYLPLTKTAMVQGGTRARRHPHRLRARRRRARRPSGCALLARSPFGLRTLANRTRARLWGVVRGGGGQEKAEPGAMQVWMRVERRWCACLSVAEIIRYYNIRYKVQPHSMETAGLLDVGTALTVHDVISGGEGAYIRRATGCKHPKHLSWRKQSPDASMHDLSRHVGTRKNQRGKKTFTRATDGHAHTEGRSGGSSRRSSSNTRATAPMPTDTGAEPPAEPHVQQGEEGRGAWMGGGERADARGGPVSPAIVVESAFTMADADGGMRE